MKIAVVILLLCFGLGACGQKGPLYLPQPAKPQPEAPQKDEPAPQSPAQQSNEPAPTSADPT